MTAAERVTEMRRWIDGATADESVQMNVEWLAFLISEYDQLQAEVQRLTGELESNCAAQQVAVTDQAQRLDDALAQLYSTTEAHNTLVASLTKATSEAANRAVRYLLDRLQRDANVYWRLGWGTESFRLLCLAEAEETGETFEVVEARRRKCFDDRKSEVEELRERIAELEGKCGA